MSDWSSDVCSSDLVWGAQARPAAAAAPKRLLFPAPVPLVQHALGPVQRISLSVVDAQLAQQLDDARAGHPFGHHLEAALVADLGDGVDDRAAHRVVLEFADEKNGRAPSEIQSLMRNSYAVFCLKKKKKTNKKDK